MVVLRWQFNCSLTATASRGANTRERGECDTPAGETTLRAATHARDTLHLPRQRPPARRPPPTAHAPENRVRARAGGPCHAFGNRIRDGPGTPETSTAFSPHPSQPVSARPVLGPDLPRPLSFNPSRLSLGSLV
ncbi:hypothetical protein SKAU_G00050340 [Synaphobranchus kaupii]|uniref:Uncharacterized protein n=1 Tax=Synaphobranchus kaupii TaxID=118154 RepID=A0A9Q1G3X4_SYNKA|nr:hypothetical protein SKAU_G00050340 [Synaphobranchus kaupii]